MVMERKYGLALICVKYIGWLFWACYLTPCMTSRVLYVRVCTVAHTQLLSACAYTQLFGACVYAQLLGACVYTQLLGACAYSAVECVCVRSAVGCVCVH